MPTQASHGFSVGDWIRHNGTIWTDAQADSESNAETLALVSAVADTDNFTAATHGYVSTLSGLTAGTKYYLDPSSSGSMTATKPSTPGEIAKGVFFAVSTTAGYVIIEKAEVIGDTTTTTRHTYVDAAAMVARTTNGATSATEELATNDVMSDHFLFDSATEEGVQFRYAMPQDYVGGAVNVILFWDAASGASAADGVTWGISMQAFQNDDALDNAFGSSIDTDDTVIAVGDLHEGPTSADVTISGSPTAGDIVWGEITRVVGDANDDMTEDAKLLGALIQYDAATYRDSYVEWSIPAGNFSSYTTNGAEWKKTVYSSNEVGCYAFDPSTEEAIHLQFELPQDYQAGSVIRWGVNWDGDTSASGTAVFGLSGGAIGNDEALSTALGTERTVTDTLLAVGDRHRSPNDATGITLAGSPVAGDWVQLKLVVKTSGTIAVDVLFLGLQLQYQKAGNLDTAFA